MSGILQNYFSDPDGKCCNLSLKPTTILLIILSVIDIKFEEFYDFFCTNISNKTKNNLRDVYNQIKGDKE